MGYSKDELAKSEKKFDAILDAYGKMDLGDACRLLETRRNICHNPDKAVSFLLLTSCSACLLEEAYLIEYAFKSGRYGEMEKLFIDKKLYPVIEHYFTLDHSAEAFELAEHGKPRGKIIIRQI